MILPKRTGPAVAVAAVLLAAGCGLSAAPVNNAEQAEAVPPAPPADASPPVLLPVGGTLMAGAAHIQLTKLVEMPAFGSYNRIRASEGAEFIGLEYRLTNVSLDQFPVAEAPQPVLVAPDGTVYQPDPDHTIEARVNFAGYSSPPQLLSPGVTLKTVVIFEVAKDRFDRRTWAASVGNNVLVRLPPAPRPAPAPPPSTPQPAEPDGA